jgi:hypothetical protein
VSKNGFNPKRKGGPRGRRQEQPTDAVQMIIHLAKYAQSFDKEAFDQLIQSQGVYVTHYRALPDPSGMASIGDTHAVQSKRDSSDSFLYKEAGDMHIWFSANTSDWEIEVEGLTKHDAAVVSFPMVYDDGEHKGEDVIVSDYDRFYLKDIEVRVVAKQYVEASSTGVDKLQYPAVFVEELVDADKKEYRAGVNFEITDEGFIRWISQDRPGWNEKTLRGTVYAIRYRYTPYFVVAKMMHEIRVSQITNPETFERHLERMPFQALLYRENVLSDQNNDPMRTRADQRFQNAPPVSGVTGPKDSGSDGGML